MQIYYILAAVLGIWLISLTVVLYKLFKKFASLSKGIEEDLAKKGFAEAKNRLDFLEADGRAHVQKVGLVRFNPFRELGGAHSFSLAILDGENSGVVITGLHARDMTRIYVKDINRGKAALDLSSEEKKALTQATNK